MADGTVVLEDAIDAWPATDTELRVRTIKWRVRVTWLVKPHHHAIVIAELFTVHPRPSVN